MKAKSVVKVLILVVVLAFVVLQFFQVDKTAPTIVQADTLESVVTVPPDVSAILSRSCNDCHTNNTRYPWYSYMQPFGWFLKGHIDEGRQKLNLSTFRQSPPNRQAKKLAEMCSEVEKGDMPLPSYLWIHRDAVLKPGDAKILCDWAKAESDKLD